MSREAGYTLADMLAAVVVVGLAIGGLGQGVHVIARQQAATTDAIDRSADAATIRDGLAGLLAFGPDATTLTGSAHGINLDCGVAQRCLANLEPRNGGGTLVLVKGSQRRALELSGEGPFRFAYQAGDGTHETWPPAVRLALNSLRGVAIFDSASAGSLPVAYVRIREQQAFHCEYDTISAECRVAR